LASAGADLRLRVAFADHHAFSAGDLERLSKRAAELGATLVTTPKDAVRLPDAFRDTVTVIGVGLAWRDLEQLETLLRDTMTRGRAAGLSRDVAP
jgi:tetraacyldisaccharide 4'-kinase